ncbi:hypothetical protein CAPTEDRAFT_217933 [Capitella teleta]|uniref:Uncharacterized protein n=1 Tax=Capitella teleta TaxID=283909 RepID=R7VCG5_CAPTE|nr:hypothetical protein CAPTEDRAFT_217933 [Capitella teleta]|eukprot:ELU14006.1 hypothetical protein CAPTEDRAFT_217933 [Capitella teleta]
MSENFAEKFKRLPSIILEGVDEGQLASSKRGPLCSQQFFSENFPCQLKQHFRSFHRNHTISYAGPGEVLQRKIFSTSMKMASKDDGIICSQGHVIPAQLTQRVTTNQFQEMSFREPRRKFSEEEMLTKRHRLFQTDRPQCENPETFGPACKTHHISLKKLGKFALELRDTTPNRPHVHSHYSSSMV